MGHTVLIVDDSPVIRSVLQRCLTISPIAIDTMAMAVDGRDALGQIEKRQPDILLCDLHMPNMTGMDLLEQLHHSGRLQTITTIIISSDRSQERRHDLERLGIATYLTKPFTPDGVVHCIEEAVANAESTSS